jgi:hypothetical protein
VRASKKGEVLLLMCKLDKLSMRPTEDPEVATADATVVDQGLVTLFAGPEPVDKEYSPLFATSYRRRVLSLTRTLWSQSGRSTTRAPCVESSGYPCKGLGFFAV